MTTITVVEQNPLIRLGIVQCMADVVPNMHVEGVDLEIDPGIVSEAQPDLVLLGMPSTEHQANELIDAVQERYSPVSMILLAKEPAMPLFPRTLPRSICGYLPKDSSVEVIRASVRLVLAGGTCFPAPTPSVKEHDTVARAPSAAAVQPGSKQPPLKPVTAAGEPEMLGLTPRQYEVLVLLARGHPMKTVGRCLGITTATAKAHTESIYLRLDVNNRNAAVYEAMSRGASLGWPSLASHVDT